MPGVILVGDNEGVPQLLRHVRASDVLAVVGASNRSGYHESLRAIAGANDVPFIVQPLRRHDSYGAFIAKIERLAPDVVLVNSYSQILYPDFLAVPPLGCFNAHAAPLPRYRGSNPIQWAIIRDERNTGVTLHRMSAEVDQGPIVAQAMVPILFEDTWLDVRARVQAAFDELLGKNLPRVVAGDAESTEQDETQALTMPRRTPDDGLFSWNAPLIDIYNQIRALTSPLPGAFALESGVHAAYPDYLSIQRVFELAGRRRAFRYGSATIRPADTDPRAGTRMELLVSSPGMEQRWQLQLDWSARIVRPRCVDGPVPLALAAFCTEELRLRLDDADRTGLER